MPDNVIDEPGAPPPIQKLLGSEANAWVALVGAVLAAVAATFSATYTLFATPANDRRAAIEEVLQARERELAGVENDLKVARKALRAKLSPAFKPSDESPVVFMRSPNHLVERNGQTFVVQRFEIFDAQADAHLVNYVVRGTNRTEPLTVRTSGLAPPLKESAVLQTEGEWQCTPGEVTEMSALVVDRAGNISEPIEYVIRCPP